ncbi:MAG TPA: hypothetical protein VKX25_11655 [Bryobacteraceae bacterium]|jgi:hypothetical protein|nr:hypothetical protein [Bryobacteraceae bacterium]
MANTGAALRYQTHWKSAAELNALPQDIHFKPLKLRHLEAILPAGLQRGIIAELHGVRSVGVASLCFHVLAEATAEGEVCAVVDLNGSFDPASAAAAGIALERIIWVNCSGNPEAAMRACDLLLHAGGFGVVYLDLSEASARLLNKIPVSYWHRFRQAVEHSPTILLVSAPTPQAGSRAALRLEIRLAAVAWSGQERFTVLRGLKNVVTRGGKMAPVRPHILFLKAA